MTLNRSTTGRRDNSAVSVVIPADYDGRKGITPIYLNVMDRNGQRINQDLWEQGVAPNHGLLCQLARHWLGDVTRVSELAQAALYRVWEEEQRNEASSTISPRARIASAARYIARGWRYGDARNAARFVNLDSTIDIPVEDPELEYIKHIDANALIDRMRPRMSSDEERILDLFLNDLNGEEIAAIVKKKRRSIQSMLIERALGVISRRRP